VVGADPLAGQASGETFEAGADLVDFADLVERVLIDDPAASAGHDEALVCEALQALSYRGATYRKAFREFRLDQQFVGTKATEEDVFSKPPVDGVGKIGRLHPVGERGADLHHSHLLGLRCVAPVRPVTITVVFALVQ
jgi:hypothetical protein